MPSYTHKTKIIFLDLPKKVQEEIDKIRAIFNPHGVKRGLAHVTFKQDEDFLIGNDQLMEIVEKETRSLTPFVLEMDGIRIKYDEDHFTIFVAFKSNSILNAAVADLSKILAPYVDVRSPGALKSTYWEQSVDFFAHVTIVTGKGEKEGKDLYNKIASQDFEAKGEIVCDSLSILEWNTDHWKMIGHVDLHVH